MPTLVHSHLIEAMQREPKEIPFSFLYNQRGCELYDQITELESYYPFMAEKNLLEQHAKDMARMISPAAVVVELGCGSGLKTTVLLQALLQEHGRCRYVGIDVAAPFLSDARRNILSLVPGIDPADISMVQHEYMEGLREARRLYPTDTLCIIWLGSSVGNLTEDGAVKFFRDVLDAAGTNIQFLLCADMWKDAPTLHLAYCDPEGVTAAFIKNGVTNALLSLGYVASREEEAGWEYEVDVNSKRRRVEMWVRFPQGLRHSLPAGIAIRPNERVLMEVSRKFTPADISNLSAAAGFSVHAAWRTRLYGAQLLLPLVSALKECWQDTDDLFLNRIQNWLAKPIDLRHPFCFYYGHVASFSRLKMLPSLPPSSLDVTFSRGIDPSVLNPSSCHSHPEVPPEWPSREEIQSYVQQTRALMMSALQGTGKSAVSPRLILMALEHERMHLETLEYMMLQQEISSFNPPLLPAHANLQLDMGPELASFWPHADVIMPAGKVLLGAPSPAPSEGFLWDNESPPLPADVANPFAVSSRSVTVAQFRCFVVEQKGYETRRFWKNVEDFEYFRSRGQSAPATWSCHGGQHWVHVPGEQPRPWWEVADQPAWVSLAEAEAFCCAVGNGCRIMSEAEWQRIADFKLGVEDGVGSKGRNGAKGLEGIAFEKKIAGTNGIIPHDIDGERMEELQKSIRTGGWEWTSTKFKPFPGFEAASEYPEYSTDFFDDVHFVLKGSSPVTHASMLRDSFRNYYQRQYPYVFAKFRCCVTVAPVCSQ